MIRMQFTSWESMGTPQSHHFDLMEVPDFLGGLKMALGRLGHQLGGRNPEVVLWGSDERSQG